MKRLGIMTLVMISAASLVVVSPMTQTGSAAEQAITAKRSISGTVQYADTREPIATTAPAEPTPESLGRILKARSSFNEIDLNANAVLQIESRLIDH